MQGAANLGAGRGGAVPISVERLEHIVEACACATRARAAAAAASAAARHAAAEQKLDRERAKDRAMELEAGDDATQKHVLQLRRAAVVVRVAGAAALAKKEEGAVAK